MSYVRRAAIGVALASPILPAPAATLSASAFSYDGGSPGFTRPNGDLAPVYAGWNPRPGAQNPHVHDEGVHIAFFGRSPACPDAVNGPAGPLDAASKTRLRRNAAGARLAADTVVWSPQPDAAHCPAALGAAPGPAFVAAPPAGLQLFTAVMPQSADGVSAFWGQIEQGGEPGKGTNASIEATFIAWNFNWRTGEAIQPWSANHTGAVQISSDMSVTDAVVEAEPPGARSNQAKQQYAASFLNKDCQQQASSTHVCQVRFIFEAGYVRKPGVNWPALGWAQRAHLLFDAAQAGLPVIEGPLKEAGGTTQSAGTDPVPLWTSVGAATQRGPFARQHFTAEMTFAQFTAALRIIVQAAQRVSANADMAALFGPSWNDPASWLIVGLNASQEIHAIDPVAPVIIAGSVNTLHVTGAR